MLIVNIWVLIWKFKGDYFDTVNNTELLVDCKVEKFWVQKLLNIQNMVREEKQMISSLITN